MGGRGGALRVTPKPATPPVNVTMPAPAVDVTTLLNMDDQTAAATLSKAFSTKIDADQQDSDTQRFFNAIGWADKKPRVLDEKHFEGARRSCGADSIFHTDAPCGPVTDAKTFADQFMGKGRQFISAGCHGDGTYFAVDSADSWNYGNYQGRACQYKAFLSSRAKVITQRMLLNKLDDWRLTHPAAYQKLYRCSQSYSHGSRGNSVDGSMSIFAAMLGYNVIKWNDYYSVLDRSAITCCSKVRHYNDSGIDTNDNTW